MKRTIFVIVCMAMLLSACAPKAMDLQGRTSITTVVTTTSTAVTTTPTSKVTTTETAQSEVTTTDTAQTETTTTEPTTTAKATTIATAKAPTTTAPKTTAPPVQPVVKELLNAAPLTPQKTNFEALDTLVEHLFIKIHTEGMSTYDKVVACYDYLVNTCEYQKGYTDTSILGDTQYTSMYDMMMVVCAHQILATGQGVCDNYSAAFAVMCRRIGLDAHLAGGTISKKGGGRTGHAWAYINLNSTPYLFDPQVQSSNKDSRYFFFGKTYEQMGTRYEQELSTYNEVDFAQFALRKKITYDMAVTLTMSSTQNSVSFEGAQKGGNTYCNVEGVFHDGLMAKEDNTVELTVNPSGGSRRYVLLFLAEDEESDASGGNILLETLLQGSATYTLDLAARFSGKAERFFLVLLDEENTQSELLFSGIVICPYSSQPLSTETAT